MPYVPFLAVLQEKNIDAHKEAAHHSYQFFNTMVI